MVPAGNGPWARFDDLDRGEALLCPTPHRVLTTTRSDEVAEEKVRGAVGIFLVSLIRQLLARLIVGATNSGFQATFRVASYTQVTSLVNWIPFIGPLLALYGIYLSIVGIREMHKTTTAKLRWSY